MEIILYNDKKEKHQSCEAHLIINDYHFEGYGQNYGEALGNLRQEVNTIIEQLKKDIDTLSNVDYSIAEEVQKRPRLS